MWVISIWQLVGHIVAHCECIPMLCKCSNHNRKSASHKAIPFSSCSVGWIISTHTHRIFRFECLSSFPFSRFRLSLVACRRYRWHDLNILNALRMRCSVCRLSHFAALQSISMAVPSDRFQHTHGAHDHSNGTFINYSGSVPLSILEF